MRNTTEKPNLSPREHQLIALAGEGLTDTAIAHRLGISEATVNTYWGRIRVKLGPHNRTELVAIALRSEFERKLNETPDYSAILRAMPDALITAYEDGLICDANAAAGELFGYDLDELVGMDLQALIPERYRQDHGDHVAGYLLSPQRRPMGDNMRTIGLKKTGEEFSIDATLSTVALHGRELAICSIREVGE